MDYSRAVELGGERTHGGDDLPEVLFLREVQVDRGRSGIVELGLEIELAEEAQDEDDVKGSHTSSLTSLRVWGGERGEGGRLVTLLYLAEIQVENYRRPGRF
ncbi:hypothetical protein RRG08_019147 [Elysia crispata]|uniref:Uncharacterized protein n=1 Tax=Elysia crispata TaxID=231223 RepID=A0AAE1EDE5_9GAST|nr:hypothetical protein RRG08_019147 [Elysia crispata]